MTIGSHCERLLPDSFDLTHVSRARSLRFSLQWDDTNIIPPCRTNLTVTRGTRTVATKSIRAPDDRLHHVTVALPPGARHVPLRVSFRWAQSCRSRSGGHPAGGFVLGATRRSPR